MTCCSSYFNFKYHHFNKEFINGYCKWEKKGEIREVLPGSSRFLPKLPEERDVQIKEIKGKKIVRVY